MKKLTSSQRKALSEFLNTIAAGWFSAGIIAPFFIKPQNIVSVIIGGGLAIIMTMFFLGLSLYLVRRIKV